MRDELASRRGYASLFQPSWPHEPDFILDNVGMPMREPVPLASFDEVRRATSLALAEAVHPHETDVDPAVVAISDSEMVALRLWTGPLGDKYQSVLRAAPGLTASAVAEFRQLCMPEEGIPPPYLTTLHAINHATIK